MSRIELSQATEDALVGHHDAASTGITDLADSVPTEVDGGLGTPELLAILSAAVETADELAQVNELLAATVKAVHDNLQLTDESLAGSFEQVADQIPDKS